MFSQKTLIAIIAIVSGSIIVAIALTRNTDTKVNVEFGRDGGSLTIEGKQSPSLPEATKVDCLSGEDNSQLLNCDS